MTEEQRQYLLNLGIVHIILNKDKLRYYQDMRYTDPYYVFDLIEMKIYQIDPASIRR